MTSPERAELESGLARIENALRGAGEQSAPAPGGGAEGALDPYAALRARASSPSAAALATPADLQRDLSRGGPQPSDSKPQRPTQAEAAPKPAAASDQQAPPETAAIGTRAAEALESIDFPGFVAGLVTGTFQAIVDATAQQVREYADLVSSLARSVDDFARDNVGDTQVRSYLAERYPADLRLVASEPGKGKSLRLLPQVKAEGSSPEWLAGLGLSGEALSEELTEGALLTAGRRKVGEDRMQTLATMVLMGINRIVVDEGHISAKMQFHAAAQDRRSAEMAQLVAAQQSAGISGRQVSGTPTGATMVSTVKANAQADASVRADLMGEVRIQFSTQTFPLERFADSAAIQLINRHARWQPEKAEAPATAPAQEAATPKEGT